MITILMVVVFSLLGILIAMGINLIFAIPMMWLWNWLMPAVLGLGEITYWQAWGLLFLCSLMFKSSYVQSSKKN